MRRIVPRKKNSERQAGGVTWSCEEIAEDDAVGDAWLFALNLAGNDDESSKCDRDQAEMPMSAFKSKSDRKNDVSLKEVGDPGAYNPYDNTTLAAQTSKSFNKSQQTGAGGFGTKVKRAELSVPNDAPGPGTYDAKLPEAPEAKQGSAFASQTKRGAYLPKAQTPGAGEYDPQMAQEKIGGGDSMFKNKDERFKKSMELEYSAHVGPGSYAQGQATISTDTATTTA